MRDYVYVIRGNYNPFRNANFCVGENKRIIYIKRVKYATPSCKK